MIYVTHGKVIKSFGTADDEDDGKNYDKAYAYVESEAERLFPDYHLAYSFSDDDTTEEDYICVVIYQNDKCEMEVFVIHKKFNVER